MEHENKTNEKGGVKSNNNQLPKGGCTVIIVLLVGIMVLYSGLNKNDKGGFDGIGRFFVFALVCSRKGLQWLLPTDTKCNNPLFYGAFKFGVQIRYIYTSKSPFRGSFVSKAINF